MWGSFVVAGSMHVFSPALSHRDTTLEYLEIRSNHAPSFAPRLRSGLRLARLVVPQLSGVLCLLARGYLHNETRARRYGVFRQQSASSSCLKERESVYWS